MFKDNFSKLLYITKYEFFFITPYCPTFLMGATLLHERAALPRLITGQANALRSRSIRTSQFSHLHFLTPNHPNHRAYAHFGQGIPSNTT